MRYKLCGFGVCWLEVVVDGLSCCVLGTVKLSRIFSNYYVSSGSGHSYHGAHWLIFYYRPTRRLMETSKNIINVVEEFVCWGSRESQCVTHVFDVRAGNVMIV
jgi:hypothetical protein